MFLHTEDSLSNMPRVKRTRASDLRRSFKRMRTTRRTQATVPRRLNPPGGSFRAARVMQFKRSEALTLSLNNTSPPTGWLDNNNGLVQTLVTGLSSVPGNADFVNLFDSYRITGLRLQGYYSGTTAERSSNQNAMLLVCPNHLGNVSASDLEEQWFMDRPRTKKIPLLNDSGRASFDIYMPLSQLSETYQSATGTDYALVEPHFISTSETSCPHYGSCLRIQRMDGEAFTSGTQDPYPYIKIIQTWYIEMRGAA